MTITLGIFDLLTYAVPGALQLTVLLYVGQRLHWVDLSSLLRVPSGVLFVGLALVSYLLGHIVYTFGKLFDRLFEPNGNARWQQARDAFIAHTPSARDRPFVHSDSYLLLAALQLQAREAAVEISRFRAAGLMLRSCALPLALGTMIALVEFGAAPHQRVASVTATTLLGLATIMSVRRSAQLRNWARSKTFQLAYWLPGIDAPLLNSASAVEFTADGGDQRQAAPVHLTAPLSTEDAQ